MAIKIYKDKIEFIDGANVFTLTETTAGFDLNGTLTADSFGGVFQGTVAGYTSGGITPTGGGPTPPTPGYTNVIDKFPFATNANATDVGDLSQIRASASGQSSSTRGYSSGGIPPGGLSAVIDSFPFATNTNATNVGSLTSTRWSTAGHSSSEFGYISGGGASSPPTGSLSAAIEKFPFASNSNATNVGNLTLRRQLVTGTSSSSFGYSSGGRYNPPGGSPPFAYQNIIDRFPFASDSSSTDVGDLTVARDTGAGQSSETRGYTSAGGTATPPGVVNTIDSFPFATNANATDVGDISAVIFDTSGQSSTVSGYNSGGVTGSTRFNTIDRFPFATNANATDVGDITLARNAAAGQQD